MPVSQRERDINTLVFGCIIALLLAGAVFMGVQLFIDGPTLAEGAGVVVGLVLAFFFTGVLCSSRSP